MTRMDTPDTLAPQDIAVYMNRVGVAARSAATAMAAASTAAKNRTLLALARLLRENGPALDADEVLQIRAIRVGVVTRHPQFEKTAVPAPPVPAWMGDATTDLIAANANYRHRVFETVIPLRNVIWAP